MIYQNLDTGVLEIDPKNPPGLRALDSELTAKMKKLQKRITLMERKGFLEAQLSAVRATNSDFMRGTASHESGNDQTRVTSTCFSDGWKAAYACVERLFLDQLTKIEIELAEIIP